MHHFLLILCNDNHCVLIELLQDAVLLKSVCHFLTYLIMVSRVKSILKPLYLEGL